ncbi:MAG: MBL fold metallo-hydrolase [Myxococcota bacterium]
MEFSIVSHAGMLVESGGKRLVIDPWTVGSCYWRAWWNYPPAPEWALEMQVDWIYLTHLHWDHFHGPSLRKLPREATLLVPESHFLRMKKDGEIFKFKEIVELPHGKTVELAPGFQVTSYQMGLMMDSTLVVSDGTTTIVDMNDCKLQGPPLQQVIRRHPKVDFVLRSHSSANAYPWCVEAEDPDALSYRAREDYMSEFVATARILGARYAIPFASSHCFLHKDTLQFNDVAVSPPEVKAHFDAHKPEGSECVVMLAGDSWSDEDGFRIVSEDWYADRDERIAAYAERERDRLEATYALEETVEVPFRAFHRYFRAQVESLPRLSRALFKPVVVFEIKDRPDVHWVVDYDQRRVYESETRPEEYALRLEIPALVLKDCIYKKMFSTFSASKRLHVELRRGHHRDFLIFFQLLDMYEYEYFPLRKMLTWRFVRVWARRWREIWMYASLLASVALRRKGEDPLTKFVPKIDAESRSA